jgi:hypothetical protein
VIFYDVDREKQKRIEVIERSLNSSRMARRTQREREREKRERIFPAETAAKEGK